MFYQKKTLLIYNKNILQMKRQLWTQREDQILYEFLSSFHRDIETKEWSEWTRISRALKESHPSWTRTPKQCRQRWKNYLSPSLNISSKAADVDDSLNVQKFLQSLNQYGKKWSVIKNQFPGRSENSLKNFFYSSIRKGLNNLNYYNRNLRSNKIFKKFNGRFLSRVLAANDEKKFEDLTILDSSAFQISKNVIKVLVLSGQHKTVLNQQSSFYEDMQQTLSDFGKKCRFKKGKLIEAQSHSMKGIFHNVKVTDKQKDYRQEQKLRSESEKAKLGSRNMQLIDGSQCESIQPNMIRYGSQKPQQRMQTIDNNSWCFEIRNNYQVNYEDDSLFDVIN